MHNVKFFVIQAVMIILLALGLSGVEGAFNLYAAAAILFAMMFAFMWMDEPGVAAAKKLIESRRGRTQIPGWIRYSILGGQVVVLVWFGHFIVAALWGFSIITTATRVESLVKVLTAQMADEMAPHE